jgi:hypothetical protein
VRNKKRGAVTRRQMSWRENAADAVVDVARTSQALVVESLDRTVGQLPSRQLLGVVVRRLTPLVDDAYELTIDLLRLHREFVQRMADAVAPAEPKAVEVVHDADVLPIERAPRHSISRPPHSSSYDVSRSQLHVPR